MKYHEVVPISRVEAEAAFAGGISSAICDALIRVTYHDPDWQWVQEWCIALARHPDSAVRGLAANCFGHLARIHHKLELEKVMPVLNELFKDPEVSGRVQDAFDDIEIYLGRHA